MTEAQGGGTAPSVESAGSVAPQSTETTNTPTLENYDTSERPQINRTPTYDQKEEEDYDDDQEFGKHEEEYGKLEYEPDPEDSDVPQEKALFSSLEEYRDMSNKLYSFALNDQQFHQFQESSYELFDAFLDNSEEAGIKLFSSELSDYLEGTLGGDKVAALQALQFYGFMDFYPLVKKTIDAREKALKAAEKKSGKHQSKTLSNDLSGLTKYTGWTTEQLSQLSDTALERIIDEYLAYSTKAKKTEPNQTKTMSNKQEQKKERGYPTYDGKASELRPVGKNEKGQPVFSQDDIRNLSRQDYERLNDKIMELYRRGQVV